MNNFRRIFLGHIYEEDLPNNIILVGAEEVTGNSLYIPITFGKSSTPNVGASYAVEADLNTYITEIDGYPIQPDSTKLHTSSSRGHTYLTFRKNRKPELTVYDNAVNSSSVILTSAEYLFYPASFLSTMATTIPNVDVNEKGIRYLKVVFDKPVTVWAMNGAQNYVPYPVYVLTT